MNVRDLFIIILAVFLSNCSNKSKEAAPALATADSEQNVSVEITVIQPVSFVNQIVSNGKLTARHKSELRFNTTGKISKIYIANGSQVTKNQLLAEFENLEQANQLTQARNQLQEAQVSKRNLLIEYGLNNKPDSLVEKNILENVNIKSGYLRALATVKMIIIWTYGLISVARVEH